MGCSNQLRALDVSLAHCVTTAGAAALVAPSASHCQPSQLVAAATCLQMSSKGPQGADGCCASSSRPWVLLLCVGLYRRPVNVAGTSTAVAVLLVAGCRPSPRTN